MTHTLRLRATPICSLLRVSLAVFLCLSLVPAAGAVPPASRRTSARAQFERANKQRTALRAKTPSERSLADFSQLIAAYRRVYLISPRAAEAPAALLAVAEAYQEMGQRFDSKYYQSAVDAYQFLLHEYPGNRYREHALLTIGNIQKDNLGQPELARKTFEEFLKQHPGSKKAAEVRHALSEITAVREDARKATPQPQPDEQQDAGHKLPHVTRIRSWNAENYTRIVIDLEGEVKYQAGRVADPDRIYFDIYSAKLNPALAARAMDVKDGFLKRIRVAQNQAGVVRVVLEVDKVKEYSAYLLPNPYRLVVDVHGAPVMTAKAAPPPAADLDRDKGPISKPAPLPEKAPPKTEVARAERSGPPAASRKPEPAVTEPRESATPQSKRAAQKTPRRKQGKQSDQEVAAAIGPPPVPQPNRNGQHSLTRALGLKIGRIVIDAGHGGHDTGTIGPTGLMEKDLCLDVALRLGKIIHQRLPNADVVYTRQDDSFVPLEERTAVANQAKADLFISIHANSSRDHKARGVETYYLNFSASEDAMEVASRENALAQGSLHELQDLIKKIARNEKIEESRELALEVQHALAGRLQKGNRSLKDRGVKKAPFVVLIGANMPSVLSEVAFISNPSDEQLLKKPDQRQRVAEGLYHGVESYLHSINSLTYNQPNGSPGARPVRLARAGNSQ